METTENLGLNLPESTDFYDVAHQNENMQIIDKEVDALNTHKTDKTVHITPTERTNWNKTATELVGMQAQITDNACKNLLEVTSDTISAYGVEFKVNEDKSVKISGTATTDIYYNLNQGFTFEANEEYIVSGCTDGSSSTYFMYVNNGKNCYTEGVNVSYSVETTKSIGFHIKNGTTINTTVYPMIRKAEITDSTYEPHYKTNKELTEEVDSHSALLVGNAKKNLLKNTGKSQTINGLTFTVNNDDGSVAGKGTSTNEAQLTLSRENLKAGKYILSGGNSATKRVVMQYVNKSTGAYVSTKAISGETEVEFEITEEEYNNYNQVYSINIRVGVGMTLDETFYPMVRKAEITDSTYEPYCMSNQELTEQVNNGVVNSSETANKLATARNIGKASFDGTKNIALENIMGRASTTDSGTANKNKYTKIARISMAGAYYSCIGTLNVLSSALNVTIGQLNFLFRLHSTISSYAVSLKWLSLSDTPYEGYEESIVAVKVSDGVFDLYFKPPNDYDVINFTLIDCIGSDFITLYSKQEYVDSVTPVATSSLQSMASKAVSADSVPSTGQASVDGNRKVWFSNIQAGIENDQRAYDTDFTYNAYTNTLNVQNVNGTSSKAISDGNGNVIADTYAEYEEGEWTPTVVGCTVSSATKCYYKKIGKVVHIQGYFMVSGTSSVVSVGGLPYPVDPSNSSGFGSVQYLPVRASISSGGMEDGCAYGGSSTSAISFMKNLSTSTRCVPVILHGYYFTVE